MRTGDERTLKALRVRASWVIRRLSAYTASTGMPHLDSDFRALRRRMVRVTDTEIWTSRQRADGSILGGTLREPVIDPDRRQTRRVRERFLVPLFAAGLVALTIAFREAVGEAMEALSRAHGPTILAAFALFIVGRGGVGVFAFVWTARRLAGVSTPLAAIAWLRPAVGKYLPGMIWHPFGMVEYLRRAGAKTSDAVSVVTLDMAATLVGGVIVGALALPWLISERSGSALWLLLAVPPVLALHPRVFAWVVGMVERRRGASAQVVLPSWRLVTQIMALHIGGWILAGVSTWLVLIALDVHVALTFVVPASALSWAVGLLFVIAPAGLGVREGVFVALVATQVATAEAVATAVVSRFMFVGVDFLAALSGSLLSVRRRSVRGECPDPANARGGLPNHP